ncbi:MAG: deoxyribose-phosphate aldolase [Bacteroidaceae bacterium]|nr:deoxyribose-phosphate aldolase [Prevotellaceae bacterium]MDY3063069.1 deoxyribose-phosphate aldolase [Bacteroidaceae bacterium]
MTPHLHQHSHHCEHEHPELQSKYSQAFAKFNLHLHDEIVQEETKKIIDNHFEENKTTDVMEFLLGTIEITSLKVTDNEDSILQLVEKINHFTNDNPALPHPAGICVYPRFVSIVSNSLEADDMEISTVCGGFPSAQTFPEIKTIETALAIKDGATEIDTVMPVGFFLAEDYDTVYNEIDEIKLSCGQETPLKVILEVGALQTAVNVKKAAILAIYSGADYIKTSTGKIEPGATPAAVYVMCETIKEYYNLTGTRIGIKIAGGVRTTDDAIKYYTIVKEVLGMEWLDKNLFRIGASGLANNLLSDICGKKINLF